MVVTDIAKETSVGVSRYRIAVVHPSAGVNWSGGTENFAIELTRYLSPYFDIELLGGSDQVPCYYPSGGLSRVKARELISFPPLDSTLRRFSTNPEIVIEHLTNFFPCATRLLTKPADLIFPCNGYGGLAMAGLVRAILGTPVLYKAHTGLLGGGKRLALDLRFRPDHLVVFSEEMEDFAHQQRPDQAVSIIPNGVDLQKFSPDGDGIDVGLPKPLILCVGSLNRKGHKRTELAIQAVAKVPNASLLICGDGVDREYFQRMGDDLLGPARFAIRTFPFDQMPAVYRSADVFTLPSDREPFGNVFVQAMACGLPIVATDDGLRRYMVADAGVLCDVTDIDQYAESLQQALVGDWRAKVMANAERFSWQRVAADYRDLIVSMIEQSKQR